MGQGTTIQTFGRFISADSIVPYPSDPQSFNRYSYARNNPVIYTDPTGQFFGIDDLIIGAIIGAIIGGTTAAVTGGDIGQGMLMGAVFGGIFSGVSGLVGNTISYMGVPGGIGPPTAGWAMAGEIGGAIAGGASAGAVTSAMYGGDIGQGALYGGLFGFVSYVGVPNYSVFGGSAWASIPNRLVNAGITGATFGATYAGVTGGDVWQGAWKGAMVWAAGEGAYMGIGHTVGFIASGGKAPTFSNGAFIYDANTKGWITFGNVITGPAADLKQPLYAGGVKDPYNRTYFNHELGHMPQGTIFGPAYIPTHVASLTVGGLVGTFTGSGFINGTHQYGFLERLWHPAPAW